MHALCLGTSPYTCSPDPLRPATTPQCVPAHRLVERTAVTTAAEVRKQHAQRLRDNKHVRYMWVPHTEAVVVVTCNELPEVSMGRCAGVGVWV